MSKKKNSIYFVLRHDRLVNELERNDFILHSDLGFTTTAHFLLLKEKKD